MWILFLACTDKPSDGDTSGGTGDSPDDSERPVVASVDRVDCAEQQSAGEVWSFEATATDPQGPDTVDGGTVHARDGDGNQLAEYTFPCDDTGACIGSFRAVYDNLPCSLGGVLVLGFVVTDQDGNGSAEVRFTTE